MQHDLNLYKLQTLTFSTLITGANNSTSVLVDSASMGVVINLSALTGATSIAFKGQGSNDNGTTWSDVNTTAGATNIVLANLDADTTKRVFSVACQGLFKQFRLVATIVGSPTGVINAVSYQIPQDGININNNKR